VQKFASKRAGTQSEHLDQRPALAPAVGKIVLHPSQAQIAVHQAHLEWLVIGNGASLRLTQVNRHRNTNPSETPTLGCRHGRGT
jgi:hypothetical protein